MADWNEKCLIGDFFNLVRTPSTSLYLFPVLTSRTQPTAPLLYQCTAISESALLRVTACRMQCDYPCIVNVSVSKHGIKVLIYLTMNAHGCILSLFVPFRQVDNHNPLRLADNCCHDYNDTIHQYWSRLTMLCLFIRIVIWLKRHG